MREAGCTRIFEEKISGAKRDRPELERLLDHLRTGDVVTVTRLDRLARYTRDLLERIKEAGAGLRSLAERWADTTTPAGRMVLTVFAAITALAAEATSGTITELSALRADTAYAADTNIAAALDTALDKARWKVRTGATLSLLYTGISAGSVPPRG